MVQMTSSVPRVLLAVGGDLLVYWKVLIVVLTPLILLPLPLCKRSSEAACGYALLIIAIYWVTEALPIAVTAFLPVVLFPLLGILSGANVAAAYIADVSILLIGGLIMALAVEKCRLHVRIALRILLLFGTKPPQIMIGFMLPSWFLSMWLSNTATTGMMIPVAEKVIEEMWRQLRNRKPTTAASFTALYGVVNPGYELGDISRSDETQQDVCSEDMNTIVTSSVDVAAVDDTAHVTTEADTERLKTIDCHMTKMAKMLTLSIVYSANIGGTATLTGTATNLIIADAANSLYEDHGRDPPITYASWLLFGLPHAILCLLLAYAWLLFVFLGWRVFYCCKSNQFTRRADDEEVKKILQREYHLLGPITFAEVLVSVLFLVLVILWFARNPGFAPGYSSLFKKRYVTDALPAILVSILLFVFPAEKPDWVCFRNFKGRAKRVEALMDWETVSTKLPWGPVFVLGGGYALAEALKVSGLSKHIGQWLRVFAPLPVAAIAPDNQSRLLSH